MTVEFEIPRIPATINRLSRAHWSYRVREKNLWMQELSAVLGSLRLKKTLTAWADCGYKVKIEMHVIHSKEFDPDNLWSICKIPLDTLVTMGCLGGDTSRHVELSVSQEIGKAKLTKFKISKL